MTSLQAPCALDIASVSRARTGTQKCRIVGAVRKPYYTTFTTSKTVFLASKRSQSYSINCREHPSCRSVSGDDLVVRCTGDGAAADVPEDNIQSKTKAQLWWRAIKLPIFTVALVPLWVGTAAAFARSGTFVAANFWALSAAGCLIIAWLNLSNDCYDSETGVDAASRKPESVVALTGSRAAVLGLAFALLAAGAALLAAVISSAGDARPAGLLAAAVGLGYVYQGPPFRLSYRGLGEPLCFLAFGPLATSAFFLIQACKPGASALPHIAPPIAAASVIVGLTTAVILYCAHFHQEEGDRAAGKRSPIVRLGLSRALPLLKVPVVGVYALQLLFVGLHWLPVECGLSALASLSSAHALLRFVSSNAEDPAALAPSKIYATKWHALHGLLLALGLVMSYYTQLGAPYIKLEGQFLAVD